MVRRALRLWNLRRLIGREHENRSAEVPLALDMSAVPLELTSQDARRIFTNAETTRGRERPYHGQKADGEGGLEASGRQPPRRR